MDFNLKFKSIANQWILNVFLVVTFFCIVIEAVLFSAVRLVYVELVRTRSNEIAQEFSVLSMVSAENFYSSAREYAENFGHKDKIEIQILDSYGNPFFSTSGFLPQGSDMPDYVAAKKSSTGSAYTETKTKNGEKILCGTNLLVDYGNGSNGAIRWIVSLEDTNKHIFNIRFIILLAGFIVIIATAVSGMFFVRPLVIPIREVSKAARKIANGDLNTSIEIHQNNEIGELCDSINYMAAELRSADNMKNDFISSVSHELRTPLTAILGWGETAKMSIGTDEETVAKGLDVVLQEANRLSSLVEELLDFSRMQSGRLSVVTEPLSVSNLVSEVSEIYTELAQKQNVTLAYIKPLEDAIILGDRNRLKQVFINIIDNAVKYTESGGQVLIEQRSEDGCAQVIVKDTGVGIPAQDIDRVKEKFFKSNKTVRGSGIGLAIADEIIKQHKGLLFIESTEGVGTTVTAALPLHEEPVIEMEQLEVSPEESIPSVPDTQITAEENNEQM